MVGKVSGVRNKHRRQSSNCHGAPTPPSTASECDPTTILVASAEAERVAETSTMTVSQPQNEEPMFWSSDINFLESSMPGEGHFMSPLQEPDLDIDNTSVRGISYTDNCLEWFTTKPNFLASVDEDSIYVAPNDKSSTSLTSSLNSKIDADILDESKCLSTCSDIIKSLERSLGAKSQALDEVLHTCKASVTHLGVIMKAENFEHIISCRTMVSTALNLVIFLFEKCIHVEENPASSNTDGSRSFRFHFSLPRVSIGSLQFDNGEQIAFCSHLMREELSRTISLINTLKQRRMNTNSQAATSTAKIQKVWCEDFERRLKELVSLLNFQATG